MNQFTVAHFTTTTATAVIQGDNCDPVFLQTLKVAGVKLARQRAAPCYRLFREWQRSVRIVKSTSKQQPGVGAGRQ